MRVDVWADIVCPWCYLGKARFDAALSQFEHRAEVEVVYHSFELDPARPAGATQPVLDMLATTYGMSRAQAAAAALADPGLDGLGSRPAARRRAADRLRRLPHGGPAR
jgi:predicted DsbA family dithiol-disulfide isomerase